MEIKVFTVAIAVLLYTALVLTACIMGIQDQAKVKDTTRETVYYILLSVAVVLLIVSLVIIYYGAKNRGLDLSKARDRAVSFGSSLDNRARAFGSSLARLPARARDFGTDALSRI